MCPPSHPSRSRYLLSLVLSVDGQYGHPLPICSVFVTRTVLLQQCHPKFYCCKGRSRLFQSRIQLDLCQLIIDSSNYHKHNTHTYKSLHNIPIFKAKLSEYSRITIHVTQNLLTRNFQVT